MKIFFTLLLAVTASVALRAQTVLTTYYVIPPTSGCNGVLAVGPVIGNPCFSMFFTYTYTPSSPTPCGAFQGGGINGDTAFFPLCSVPCDVTIFDPNSGAICNTNSLSLGTAEPMALQTIFMAWPNPVNSNELHVKSTLPVETTISVMDASGRTVLQKHFDFLPDDGIIDVTTVTAGVYFLKFETPGGRPVYQRIIRL